VHSRGSKDVLGDTSIRLRGVKVPIILAKCCPWGCGISRTRAFLNCTKGDLCDPGEGSVQFVLEIPLQLDRNPIRIAVAPG
jgi:hypothetical protein